jgi:hypothetical protein
VRVALLGLGLIGGSIAKALREDPSGAGPLDPGGVEIAAWTPSSLGPRAALEAGADLVAFGRGFIANPDLSARLRQDAALNPLDRATLYGGGDKGYTDYPFLNQTSTHAP